MGWIMDETARTVAGRRCLEGGTHPHSCGKTELTVIEQTSDSSSHRDWLCGVLEHG